MKRIKIIGLALVAVFALSAIVASAAMAFPEFKPSNGTYPVKFTGTSGAGKLVTVGGREIKCTSDKFEGEIDAKNHAKGIKVSFLGCKVKASILGERPCNSPGAGAELIDSKTLTAKLVLVKSTAPLEAGLLLLPEEAGGNFAEIECSIPLLGTEKLKVRGSAVGVVTPINVVRSTFTLTFKQTSGKQEPIEVTQENGEKTRDTLETEGSGPENFGWEQSAVESTENFQTAETGEFHV